MKNSILLIMLILLPVLTNAQKDKIILKLNHIALSVKDVDISAKFYQEVFDLAEITNRTEVEGIRWFALGDGKELHLLSVVPGEIQLNKAVHFAMNTTNFDPFIEKLKRMKIPYSDWPGNANQVYVRADGVKQVYVQDPDGYWIEVNSAYVR